jgi:tRNA nucleotidyltransferase (CCA-adding enzyme)
MYNAFVDQIKELNLPASVDAKPVLDVSSRSRVSSLCYTQIVCSQGREVVDLFDAGPGPWVGPVLAKVTEWQLQNPVGTKDECVEWLNIERSAGRIQVNAPGAGPPTKKIKR